MDSIFFYSRVPSKRYFRGGKLRDILLLYFYSYYSRGCRKSSSTSRITNLKPNCDPQPLSTSSFSPQETFQRENWNGHSSFSAEMLRCWNYINYIIATSIQKPTWPSYSKKSKRLPFQKPYYQRLSGVWVLITTRPINLNGVECLDFDGLR